MPLVADLAVLGLRLDMKILKVSSQPSWFYDSIYLTLNIEIIMVSQRAFLEWKTQKSKNPTELGEAVMLYWDASKV